VKSAQLTAYSFAVIPTNFTGQENRWTKNRKYIIGDSFIAVNKRIMNRNTWEWDAEKERLVSTPLGLSGMQHNGSVLRNSVHAVNVHSQ